MSTKSKELGVLRKSRSTWAVVLWDDPDTEVETGFRSQRAAHERAKELMRAANA